jgi:ElaB/YqjD/DUF883 family membrane-anchored ribosome-binding protein
MAGWENRMNDASRPTSARPTSADIRREIERTRARMDRTLGALAGQVGRRQLVSGAVGLLIGNHSSAGASAKLQQAAQEAAKSAASALWSGIKRHPLQSLLIAGGLGWIAYEEFARWTGQKSEPDDPRRRKRRIRQACDRARRAAALMRLIEEKPDETSEVRSTDEHGGIEEAVNAMGASAFDWAWRALHQVRAAADHARDLIDENVEHGRETVSRTVRDHPLGTAGVAAALGVLVGLLMPRSHPEDRLLGQHAQQLKKAAKRAGRRAVRRGAQSAVASAVAPARGNGATPDHRPAEAPGLAREAADEDAASMTDRDSRTLD